MPAIVFEIDLEYPKEIQELHNNYPSAPDKIEIKWKMISEQQLNIADLYNISSGNVKHQGLTFLIQIIM